MFVTASWSLVTLFVLVKSICNVWGSYCRMVRFSIRYRAGGMGNVPWYHSTAALLSVWFCRLSTWVVFFSTFLAASVMFSAHISFIALAISLRSMFSLFPTTVQSLLCLVYRQLPPPSSLFPNEVPSFIVARSIQAP